MIVDRIMEYLGGDRLVLSEIPTTWLDTATASFRRTILRNLLDEQREERTHLSPSSPWYCPRRVFYQMIGARREEVAARAHLTFLMGDVLEAVGILLARLAGVPMLSPDVDGTQRTVEGVVGGHPLKGHLDMTVPDPVDGTEIPVDWKSMSAHTWEDFVAATNDPNGRWWAEERWSILTQVRAYMRLLGAQQGKPSTARGIVVGVNKNTGHLAELHVPFDQGTYDMLDRAVPAAHKACDTRTMPDRPPWATVTKRMGNSILPNGSTGPCLEVDHWRCGYCPFVSQCFAGFALVPLKGKPVWRKGLNT